MDHQLQHDPRTKQQIKDALYAFLYDPVQKQYKNHLDSIIIKNTQLGGYSHKSFVYKGALYKVDDSLAPRKSNRLLPQMQPQMNDYLKEIKYLNEQEVPYVLGFINQVLNSSNDFHDYLRLLPESVHSPLQKMIATCPCHNKHLPDTVVTELRTQNQSSIDLMKARMVKNLIT